MSGIWLVTPAWQRFDLTAVCLAQHRHVIDTLAAQGIEAHQVVIADDANLDLARAEGFDVVEAPNVVSDKFNAGMEYAGNHGAQWIVPIGSDSWIDPAYFVGLRGRVTRTARFYCHVTADRIGEASIRNRAGVGPYVFPRATLERVGFRPAAPGLMRRVDSSTIRGIEVTGQLDFRLYDRHPYQYVGFRVPPYITPFETLMSRWGIRERSDPWSRLAAHYPPALVDRVRTVMEAAR